MIHHLFGIGANGDLGDLQRKNFHHLMLNHTAAHISAIFYRAAVHRDLVRQP